MLVDCTFKNYDQPMTNSTLKRKTPLKRVKTTTTAQLKREADKLMSEYVRKRDKKCITCHTRVRLTCSHLITCSKNSVRWDELNCHCQCYGCNMRHEYYPEYYTAWYITNYGSSAYEELCARSQTRVKVNKGYLEGVISEIKNKLT